MKKTALMVASVCLLSGMVAWSAGPDPVTSVNAVGVAKVEIPEGFSLIASPFSQVGGSSLTVNEVVGTSVVDGTTLWFFMPESGIYFSYTFSLLDGGWVDDGGYYAGTNKILRGEGFWIQSLTNMSLSLAGEVPSANTAPTTTVTLVPGFTLFGFAYPSSTTLTATLNATEGDTIWRYSSASGIYSSYTYSPLDGGWVDDGGNVADIKLNMGEGAWYQSLSESNNIWNQVRPYQWP
jgi:hypothetical protein